MITILAKKEYYYHTLVTLLGTEFRKDMSSSEVDNLRTVLRKVS